jgi:hypothetical protein
MKTEHLIARAPTINQINNFFVYAFSNQNLYSLPLSFYYVKYSVLASPLIIYILISQITLLRCILDINIT